MSNYTKITDFAAKDALAPGNPSKIVTGTAHDDEYNAIAVAIATKADSANPTLTGTVTIGGVALTATANELNILDGVTASAAELNILDGATLTTAELNYVDGVTSAIQTQLNAKAPIAAPTFTGVVSFAANSKVLANGDVVTDRDGTTGVIYFGPSAQSKYLYYNGTDFSLTDAITISGNATASDFIISSDARLKYDIRAIRDSGSIVDALSGYRFKFKDSDVARTGVIAQEVQQVLPELVSQREDGMLTVSEGGLIAVLIEEVKSLRQRVATLEAR